jgi:DNA polymerase III epsilon subunit-like protein
MKNVKAAIKASKGKNLIVFLDTETTGVNLLDRILQNAYSVFTEKDGVLTFCYYIEEYINPERPISPFAAAVHGIWTKDLVGAKIWADSQSKKELEALRDAGAIFCAHNSPFDLGMLKKEGIEWDPTKVIDTLRVARHIFADNKEIESKGMQWLRYFFDFDANEDFQDLIAQFGIERLQAHTALSDIVVLIYLYKNILQQFPELSLKDMLMLSVTPVLDDKVSFGNVFPKGSSLYEAVIGSYVQYDKPKTGISYFNWAMKNMETLSMDQKYCISYYTMQAIEDGKLSIFSADVKPMIIFAAAFIPHFKKMLIRNNVNVVKDSELVYNAINNKIATLLADESTASNGAQLQNDFAFMKNFVNASL